ncbi:metallophosphoesterase family protein [Dyadobacter sandarakinus]|uniref:Metallophosphoesterase n=1 Tax=Dyadobacter sandarakinus TaxID=2747268 RepID=A0ABX7IC08_9BACT|nr:metallophosphoesterase [Dyadobacter sandarakinus]QRR02466.1 metallophosphoesterase [Dyadobacter sandarakinus]
MANIILHLTDLHFGWNIQSQYQRAERLLTLNGIIDSIEQLPDIWKPTIIVISGDIGWSGVKSDYEDASIWIQRLLNVTGLSSNDIVVCPGNHDIERAKCLNIMVPTSSEDADKRLTIPIDPVLEAPFTHFVEFCQKLGIPAFKIGSSDSSLVGERILKGLRFISLNSAWYCRDSDRGKLWIGYPFLRLLEAQNQLPIVKGNEDAVLTVAVAHHPFNWLNEHESHSYTSRPNVQDYLANRCHILLTGHEHAEIRHPDRIANGMYHFGGPATYAGSNYQNGFRLIKIEDIYNIQHVSYTFDSRESGLQPWKQSLEGSLPIFLNKKLDNHESESKLDHLSTNYPMEDIDGKSLGVGDFFEYVTIVNGHIPPREDNIHLISRVLKDDDCIVTYGTKDAYSGISTFVLIHQRMKTIVRRKLDPQYILDNFPEQYRILTHKAMQQGLHP